MAGIIKSGELQQGTRTLNSVAFNLEDMSDRAAGRLAIVRQQAEQIVAAAKRQADQIWQQAKEQGRQAALQEARRAAGATLDQQLASLLPALQQAVEDIRHSKAIWLQQWERQTVQLATAIAERIIRREVRQRPEIAEGLIREALELAMGAGSVTVHLSPQDYEALRDRTKNFTQQLGPLAAAELMPDAEITPGGCRVVTDFGVIDQTIEAQLSRIREELE